MKPGVLLICALAIGLRGEAAAKGWPKPALAEGPGNDIEVLFTFDDGPNAATTPQVLDILAQHKIKAVFFLVGKQVDAKNKGVPELLERIVREGHILANHTYDHTDLCKDKLEDAVRDLDLGKQTIERVTQMKVDWFRAPFGTRCDQLEAMLTERGLVHFHWDLDPQEWRHGNVKRTVAYVTRELEKASGRNVLLMHDIKQVTVKALPMILDWLDEENAKRAKAHKRRIKVLQAPALAIERIPPEIMEWLIEATAGIRDLPKTIASVLP